MNIYFVGFMGTGKTSVAKEVAKIRKLKFADIDELIEKRENRAITDIFAQSQEEYFRKIEKQVLDEVSRKDRLAVSCGGGIVLDADNIRTMKKTGIMVCLNASPEIILQRTKVFKNRPLLNVPRPRQRIEELLRQRAPYYAQADITIDTSSLTVKEIALKVLESIQKQDE